MARKMLKKCRREQISDQLRESVTAADSYAGKRLAPVKGLAQQFNTSVRTIQLALEQLVKEGLIRSRHGVGTFVALQTPPLQVADQVVVAVSMHDEISSSLMAKVVSRLHSRGRLPVSINMRHPESLALLRQAAAGPIRTFIIHGGRRFTYSMFDEPSFADKQILFIEEGPDPLQQTRMGAVLQDYASGGRQLAEHLLKRGHRRVVITAMSNSAKRLNERRGSLCGASRGRAFIDHWTAHGGTWTVLPMVNAADSLSGRSLDLHALLEQLTGPNPATAVFGYRDLEAWTVQTLLHRHQPDLLDRVEIVGYGDTFWSRSAGPPLTTVRYPTDEMVEAISQMLETMPEIGATLPRVVLEPELLDRSQPVPGIDIAGRITPAKARYEIPLPSGTR